MISLTPRQITPGITALFDLSQPTMPRAFNVLEGVTRGQILVDDPDSPRWAAVHDNAFGTLYLGGQITRALLETFLLHFRPVADVGIGCWPGSELDNMLPAAPDYDGRTLYFTEHTPLHRDLPSIPLPGGYTISSRDAGQLSQSPDYAMTIDSFGTIENIMQHTLGFVVLRDERVICEAATGAPTHGRIEIGVNTAEAHRRLGLAASACAHLIEACAARGYSTWWDCARQNAASVNLARKLGYHSEQEYRYVWWARQKPPPGAEAKPVET